jgi:thioredoxin 1
MSLFTKKQAATIEGKSNVVDLTEVDFDDSVHRNDLVMVMFCRPGCPHCTRMEPIYQELSEELVDRILFCRVNILTNASLTRRYEIAGTPTFVLIKHGSVVRSMAGERPKDLLRDELVKQL